jgi:cation transport protein ChaC
LGTNREYLAQLATQLQALEIEDPYVERLYGQIDAGAVA